MKKQIQLILNELHVSFEGKPWFGGSLLNKLNLIDYRLVNNTFLNSNSIAMLVNHMIQWRDFAIKKLQGNEPYDIPLNSDMDWPQISVTTLKEWNNLLDKLKHSQAELIQLIKEKDDVYLNEICLGKAYTNHFLLMGVIQHDIYH